MRAHDWLMHNPHQKVTYNPATILMKKCRSKPQSTEDMTVVGVLKGVRKCSRVRG